MLNKVKVSTIPLQNGECAVEIVIIIGTEQPKKVKQESPIYAETLEALAEMWMEKDKRNYGNDEDEGFLYDNLD
ncbi:MAG: hypothetical protein PHY47_24215 [Lachnospiraceae bacterium]|nr:hypothetical protein [Lachnospiraceae bacterium]